MQQSLILLILLNFSQGQIKYDTGLIQDFDYELASFNCQGGNSKTSTTQFSGTFENIPQVFIYLEKVDWSNAQLQYSLSITTITTISFTITMSCANNRVYRNQIRWFALDDQRIEVLNNFNMVNPDDKTFSIQNPNAQYGFVTVTSIHYTGAIDFTLSVNEFNYNQFSKHWHLKNFRKISKSKINRLLGVVVGVEEAFINLGLISPTGAFSSDVLPQQINKWFVIPMQGLNYNNYDNIRIKITFTNTESSIQYTYGTWDHSETPNRHSQIWVAYQFIVYSNGFKIQIQILIIITIQINTKPLNVLVSEQVVNIQKIYQVHLQFTLNQLHQMPFILQQEIIIMQQINQLLLLI